jgi:hypothetical protein
MAVSKTVRRLLQVLELEEESRRRDLESSQFGLAQLDAALGEAGKQQKMGRILFASGVRSNDASDRLVGQAEVHASRRRGEVLQQCIQESTQIVETLRTALIEKQVERKQAETLVKAAETRESLEEKRRTQQSLDAWFLMRPSEERLDHKHDQHKARLKQRRGNADDPGGRRQDKNILA